MSCHGANFVCQRCTVIAVYLGKPCPVGVQKVDLYDVFHWVQFKNNLCEVKICTLSCPYTSEKKKQGETGVSKSEKPMNTVLVPYFIT